MSSNSISEPPRVRAPRRIGLLTYALVCWASFGLTEVFLARTQPSAGPFAIAFYWMVFTTPFVILATVFHWRARRRMMDFFGTLRPLLLGALGLGAITMGGWYEPGSSLSWAWVVWIGASALAAVIGAILTAAAWFLAPKVEPFV